jgi:hypothetical protein
MKKRILTISDVHGRTNWKEQVGDLSQWNKIIFLGDYVDSYDIETNKILENLMDIIEFKKEYPDLVELLLGNHDIAYIWENEYYDCSGFKSSMLRSYNTLFNDNLQLFKVCFQIDNYIWTHAGIVNEWYKALLRIWDDIVLIGNISEQLNHMLNTKHHRQFLFRCGYSRGGEYMHGGIVWADQSETSVNPLLNYHQIVGHTVQRNGLVNKVVIDNNTSITYCDLASTESFIIEL